MGPLEFDARGVAKMTVKLGTFDEIYEFEVDTNDFEQVFALFRKGKVDRRPAAWIVLGHVELTYRDGRVVCVVLFRSQPMENPAYQPGAFSIHSTYYRGSTDADIIRVLKSCYESTTGDKRRSKRLDGTPFVK